MGAQLVQSRALIDQQTVLDETRAQAHNAAANHTKKGSAFCMATLLIVVFVLGYLAIALEHPLKVNKSASALFLGIVTWVIFVTSPELHPAIPQWFQQAAQGAQDLTHAYIVEHQLLELTGETAGLLFFLMGAMTIVELVDANHGFALITRYIKSSDARKLLWSISWLSFFMSSVLDNLTTTIVMVSILRKVVPDPKWRPYFVGVVVIAANAGGAWTPIGDVTTTMLWMAGKFTPWQLIEHVALPSIICLLVPLLVLTFMIPKTIEVAVSGASIPPDSVRPGQQALFLMLGLIGLLSVPIFKTLTHLPPFMGMLLSLAVIWIVSEIMHRKGYTEPTNGVLAVLTRIDMPSILFFLGILLAVGSLGASGLLMQLAATLDAAIGDQTWIAIATGLVSSIVDNVPLVAAGMNMYALPDGHRFWLLLAYCAGTGGSCLIIGSAAGVAAMGLENMSFIWYLKRISPLALLGYLAGAMIYVLE